MKSILSLYFLIAFAIGTDTFLVSPLLPTLRQQFHISVEASGWMIGAYALGYALFALIAGPLSDGLNRKKIMLIGILGFAVSTFLCGLAWNFWSMFAFRALAGIFAAFMSPQVWATIPVLVPASKVTKSMGIVSAGFAVSQTVGVPIGSYLATYSWKMPFFIIGGIALALFALILWIVPQFKPAAAGRQPSIMDRYAELLGANGAKGSYLAFFAMLTGAFAVFTFIGNWLSDKFGMNVSEIGQVFIFMGLGNLIGSFVGGHAAARLGGRNVLLGGIGMMAMLYLMLNLAASPLLVHLCFFVLYLVFGTVFPIMMALFQTLSSTARGTSAALTNVVNYAATTAGAYIAGIVYAQLNGFFGLTVFALLCCAVSIGLWVKSGTAVAIKRSV
ncbi:MFS transporter [Paenibacillus beijingensis]|uniref:MFS transporter n=1 Tax=Paenibacillus beijingensis TaxID=1126833 RepID=A0A0D5NKL4_9BACL|nr:MFS transporter [Paenibacillus beijingensis]AJY75552.1 MFS transporter [Paenibacillus beijingensis]